MKEKKLYIGFTPSPKMFADLDEMAQRHGVKRAVVVRLALRVALDSPRLDKVLAERNAVEE